ncbi:hypothetical protein HYH03_014564 [Edaphochlamys debaryana]|uniref:Autophagy protein 5 n=1 Tax=Edaphochlamys debaryana TaxID=47281 RepID=A0A835XNK2_9CHLO|nr:hypothetical protein HYH03_014564 [Edaphochlamys debaryana]|eukprot:KAG2486765.1 hypothetical protein HYH03_014564 [Edaphochlamys debaryana]
MALTVAPVSLPNDGKMAVAQVLAQTWATRIPVHLTLAPDSISSPSAVRPIYLMAPRQGFLSVLAAQAWPHLQHVLPTVPGSGAPRPPWFDCRGVPLKGHLPCGVLYDLLYDEGQLPWRLTVHYTQPAAEALVGWDTGATPLATFLNTLKEACFVCRGQDGPGAVMRMGKEAQDGLWAAVQAGDVGAFRSAMEALRVAPAPRQGQPPAIPLRLFVRRPAAGGGGGPSGGGTPASADSATSAATAAGHSAAATRSGGGGPASAGGAASMMAASTSAGGAGGGVGGGGSMWETCVTACSRPIPSTQPDGRATTLGQALALALPSVFGPLVASGAAGPRGAGGGGEGGGGGAGASAAGGGAGAGVGAGGRPASAGGADAASAASGSIPAGSSAAADQGSSEAAAERKADQTTGRGGAEGRVEGGSEVERGEGQVAGAGAGDPGDPTSAAGAAGEEAGAGPSRAAASTGGGGGGGDGARGGGGSEVSWPAGCRVVVGGITPPPAAPVGWLHAAMAAPDHWLYVVVRLEASVGRGGQPGAV